MKFRPEAGLHSANLSDVQVGDHSDRVRKLHALAERSPALVVDEQEVHFRRTVRGGHRGHHGLQQLAFSRSGSASDEGMGTVFAEIDDQPVRGASVEGSEQDVQVTVTVGGSQLVTPPGALSRPPAQDGSRAIQHVWIAEQFHQRDPVGQVAGCVHLAVGVRKRRQRQCHVP